MGSREAAEEEEGLGLVEKRRGYFGVLAAAAAAAEWAQYGEGEGKNQSRLKEGDDDGGEESASTWDIFGISRISEGLFREQN